MANQSIEVTLIDPEEVVETISNSLSLNSEDNQGKSIFYDSDTILLRFYSTSDSSYSVDCSKGSVFKKASDVSFTYTQYVSFSNTNSASLSYRPMTVLSADWVGKSLGGIKINGTEVSIKNPGVGILKVTYTSKYDLIQYTAPTLREAEQVMIWVNQSEQLASSNLEINPRNPLDTGGGSSTGGGQTEPPQSQVTSTPYAITVLDYSTNAALDGVTVYLNGVVKGTTDANGRVSLGNLLPGNYTLKMTKLGYFNSDEDGLNNDYFTVV